MMLKTNTLTTNHDYDAVPIFFKDAASAIRNGTTQYTIVMGDFRLQQKSIRSKCKTGP